MNHEKNSEQWMSGVPRDNVSEVGLNGSSWAIKALKNSTGAYNPQRLTLANGHRRLPTD
jgi:hypothetical protein